MKVLLTGSTGFVGSALAHRLEAASCELVHVVRRRPAWADSRPGQWLERDLATDEDLLDGVRGLDAVIHCAARVHRLQESEKDPLRAYRKVNVQGSLNLARQAVNCGAKRFIFLSTIGVHGRCSGQPVRPEQDPHPEGAYALSKYEAEQGLGGFAAASGLELVICRPPLVYGPGAPGNFGRLLRLVRTGLPLPLGAVKNRRSLVALDNLADLLMTCLDHPDAAGQTLLVSDGCDLSTPELIRGLARVLGRPARLFPVPPALLRLGGRLLGASAAVSGLVESLQVDMERTCTLLNWQPPVSVQDGLQRAVAREPGGEA